MHVLLIIEGTYPWYRGGVSEWVYQYLKNRPDFKFSILQIATDEFHGLDPSKALYPLTENITEFIRIPPPDLSVGQEQYTEDWFREVSAEIKCLSGKFEIIHVTNTGFAGWLGGRLSKSEKIPMLLTEHAIYWKEVEMGAVALECGYKIPTDIHEKKLVVSSFKDFASFTYSIARQIVTVSESNIPFQKKLGAEGIQYLPNGIPASWLISEKERGDQPVIGWVGRCAEMKNPIAFFEFAESFRALKSKPVFRMLLSEANEKALEKEVRQKATAFPEVECIWNKAAKPYFGELDFLLITSHNESQPLVMLEALAHKALPVGYRVGDLTEQYGLVFGRENTAEAIVREMERIWDHTGEFRNYVEERFQIIKQRHTWECIFSDYKDLMEKIIKQEAVTTL